MIALGTSLRVVYIAGVGRSGSTVLDGVLGAHGLIRSVGELARLVNDAWIEDLYCSCGRRAHGCPFWTAVHQTFVSNGGVSPHEYVEIQQRVEEVEWWPLLPRDRWHTSGAFEKYRRQVVQMFTAIQQVSNCSIVVDSSKGVERALALSLIPDIDLKVIHLVRDPRGVVWSHRKAFVRDTPHGLPHDISPLSTWRTALYWWRVNRQADWLRRRLGPDKAQLVRYEDLMTRTAAVLEQLGRFIGVDLTAIERAIDEGAELRFDHTIAGNRVRMRRAVRLEFDREWERELPRGDRRMTKFLAGRLMTRYGYAE